MAGFVTSAGVFANVAGQVVPLPPVHTPLAVAVRDLCDAILCREVEPCACGKFGCDCDEWHEIANTNPFELTSDDILA